MCTDQTHNKQHTHTGNASSPSTINIYLYTHLHMMHTYVYHICICNAFRVSLWQLIQELSNLRSQQKQLIKHLSRVVEPPGSAGQPQLLYRLSWALSGWLKEINFFNSSHINIYANIYKYIQIHTYTHIYIYANIYKYMQIYTNIYIHTNINKYIQIDTNRY